MSSDEWITDDGTNYYHRPEVDFSSSYAFDDDGLTMYADGMDDPVGSIQWRELQRTGGDTYIPASMRLEVGTDKEIIFGFTNGSNGLRVSNVNGKPQAIADNAQISTVFTNRIQLSGPNTWRGTTIEGTDSGDIKFTFSVGGMEYVAYLSHMFDLG